MLVLDSIKIGILGIYDQIDEGIAAQGRQNSHIFFAARKLPKLKNGRYSKLLEIQIFSLNRSKIRFKLMDLLKYKLC
jgi:hypothetical protein